MLTPADTAVGNDSIFLKSLLSRPTSSSLEYEISRPSSSLLKTKISPSFDQDPWLFRLSRVVTLSVTPGSWPLHCSADRKPAIMTAVSNKHHGERRCTAGHIFLCWLLPLVCNSFIFTFSFLYRSLCRIGSIAILPNSEPNSNMRLIIRSWVTRNNS